MPAAAQSCHRGRTPAGMCCWRDWLSSLSSAGVRLLQQQPSGASCCPAAAAPLQAHTHTRPAPSRHPPGQCPPQLRASLTFSPGGLGLPEQRHGGDRPGGGNRPGHERLPLWRAPFSFIAALHSGGAAGSGEQHPVPWGSGAGRQRRKEASAPLHPHPHPASTSTPTPRVRTLARRRDAPWPRTVRGGPEGTELRRKQRGEPGEPPGWPALPGPGDSPEPPPERGAGAARRGGGCRGAGTIKPGVIALRQMRLPRPSPSPGI